jgi:hypothetical protein
MSLGKTIYERRLALQAQQAQALEQQKRDELARNDVMWDRARQETELGLKKKQMEFERQVKLAELHGKLASMRGEKAAPQMSGGAPVQEYADLGFGLEGERLPQMANELNLRGETEYRFKMPFEQMENERARAKLQSEQENQRLTREQREFLAQARIDAGALEGRRDRAASMDRAKFNRASIEDLFHENLSDKVDARTDKGVQDYSKVMEPHVKRARSAKVFEDIIANKGPIAGTGLLKGKLPTWLMSNEGAEVRMALKDITTGEMKDTSGLAFSAQEAAANVEKLMLDRNVTDPQLRQAISRWLTEERKLQAHRAGGFNSAVRTRAAGRGLIVPDILGDEKPKPREVSVDEELGFHTDDF